MLKLPLCASIAKPSAMAIEENTLIIVSAPYVVLFFTQFSSNAKITAKNITDIFTLDIPSSVPMAIPHIAECPRASEKKAILLFTIIVPNIANTGDTNIIAINAFFINV